MTADTQDVLWLDARATLGLAELAGLCHLTVPELQELLDYGLLTPVGGHPGAPLFSAACVDSLRRAGALRRRFDLDLFVLGLMFSQFEHIGRLEQQLRSLQAHVPHVEPTREGPTGWQEPHG